MVPTRCQVSSRTVGLVLHTVNPAAKYSMGVPSPPLVRKVSVLAEQSTVGVSKVSAPAVVTVVGVG